MKDPLDTSRRRRNRRSIGDVTFDNFEAGIPVMVLEVSTPPDNETVECAHRPALCQQAVDEMAADKAGAARHQINSQRQFHLATPQAPA
jgi:hypothetical protein